MINLIGGERDTLIYIERGQASTQHLADDCTASDTFYTLAGCHIIDVIKYARISKTGVQALNIRTFKQNPKVLIDDMFTLLPSFLPLDG